MSRKLMWLALLAGGILVVGCKKEEKAPEPATPANSTTAPVTAAPGTPSIPATHTPSSTPATVPTVPTATQTPAAPQIPTSVPSVPPVTTTTPATDPTIEAKALLADAATNTEARKWDAAGDDFKKLNAMRGKLSPDLKDAVTNAEAKFVAAKAGSALKLPGTGTPPPSEPQEPNK